METNGYTACLVAAQDGLRLHVRCYGPRVAPKLPVVCLPGLSRTAADFHQLALALSRHADEPRRVLALDYRGRGRSEWDRDAANYNPQVELGDVLAVLTALGVGPAIVVGTSRGGILAMMLAALRPTALAGVVLNDIGPVIEPKGLMRIKSYVGKLPPAKSFEEGAEILRRLFDAQFPQQTAEQWLASAHRSWAERDGKLVPTYDLRLARSLEAIAPERPLPPLWNEFDALGRVPLMVVRGANSDVLSPETLTAMQARRADLDVLEVADQGHTPLLAEPETLARIAGFAARCDAARVH
jgi:pimeloyl-ACP methyl ester carboxylesterase